MKATIEKSTGSKTAASHQPFFGRNGEGMFFSESESEPFFNSSVFTTAGKSVIQARLNVGKPDDQYEREADAVADQVVQRTDNSASENTKAVRYSTSITPLIQPKCEHCEKEEKLQKAEEDQGALEDKIQRKPVFEGNGLSPDDKIKRKCSSCGEEDKVQRKANDANLNTVSYSIENDLADSKGTGSPLPNDMLQQMGDSFATDFSGVHIHTGNASIQMNRKLGSQAFTNGSDIYFNNGKFNPDTDSGQHLLAHELTHTVQQGTSNQTNIQRDCDPTISSCMPEPPVSGSSQATSEDRFLLRYTFLIGSLSPAELIQLNQGTSVNVPLNRLLIPSDTYRDIDIWSLLSDSLAASTPPPYIGSLIRNEVLKRFFVLNGVSLNSQVEIRVVGEPNRSLQFFLNTSEIQNNQGAIAIDSLDQTVSGFRISSILEEVSHEIRHFARACDIRAQYNTDITAIPAFISSVPDNFANHSLGSIRMKLNFLRTVKRTSEEILQGGSRVPEGFSAIPSQYENWIVQMQDLYGRAEAWHSANQPEMSADESYMEAGTGTVQWASDNWDEGNYVRGGLGYTGAFVLAMFDGIGNLVTFGYQRTEGQITRAYRQGDISYNEMDSLEDDAATRSLIVGTVSIGLMIATAGFGAAAAGGLGLAEGTVGFGMVSQGVAGGSFAFGTMTTESLTTRAMDSYDQSSAAQAIWMQGAHTPGQIALGTVTGFGMGAALGGAPFAADFAATRTAIFTDMRLANRLAQRAAAGPISEAELLSFQQSGFVRRMSHQWLEERGYQILYRGQGARTSQILSPIAQEQGLAASEQMVERLRAAGLTDQEIAGYTARWNNELVPEILAPEGLGGLPLGGAGLPTTTIPNIAADFAAGESGVIYVLRVPRRLAIPVGTAGWGNMSVIEQEHIIFHQIENGNVVRIIPPTGIGPLSAVPNASGTYELTVPTP